MRKPRFPLAARVDWCIEGSATRYRSTTRDVSESGMLIDTLAAAPIGAAVELVLGRRSIPLVGTIAGDHAGGVAVKLDGALDSGRRRLRRYLRTEEGRDALSWA